MNYSLSKLNNFLIFVSQYMSLVFQFFKNQKNSFNKIDQFGYQCDLYIEKFLILE